MLPSDRKAYQPVRHATSRRIRGLPNRFYTSQDFERPSDSSPVSTAPEQLRDALFQAESEEDGVRNDGLDWQGLYRVSSNWRSGHFAISELLGQDELPSELELPSRQQSQRRHPPTQHPAPSSIPVAAPPSASCCPTCTPHRPETLVQCARNFIFTATRNACDGHAGGLQGPPVSVYADPFTRDDTRRSSLPEADLTRRKPLLQIRSKALQDCRSASSHGTIRVTDIRVDEASASPSAAGEPSLDLFIAYSSGDWSIFRILIPPSGTLVSAKDIQEIMFHEATISMRNKTTIVLSSFHRPLLATCSFDFLISLYVLPQAGHSESPKLLRQMRSASSHWPATMALRHIPILRSSAPPSLGKRKRHGSDPRPSTFASLRQARAKRGRFGATTAAPASGDSQADDEDTAVFRLGIAYSTPSYPNNWTVSLQEVTISLRCKSDRIYPELCQAFSRYVTAGPRAGHGLGATEQRQRHRHARSGSLSPDLSIDAVRESHAGPDASTTPPTGTTTPRSIFAAHSERASHATPPSSRNSISYAHPYIVVGGFGQNHIEVYEVEHSSSHVTLPAGVPEVTEQQLGASTPLTLVHRNMLHGHSGSVLSVSLEDGRCVSGGSDGTVMVWTLGERAVQGGQQSTRMAHVATLRMPASSQASKLQLPTDAGLGEPEAGALLARVPTLHDILRRLEQEAEATGTTGGQRSRGQVNRPGIVKWVATTFDRIVSIVETETHAIEGLKDERSLGLEDERRGEASCPRPSNVWSCRDRERIQVWSFE